ncbi:MAG: hypothetical protein Q8Q86_01655, partial [Candidatus Daviesbacteria bacterium]|nr:hypothetical protein [Candidatus Daviesbacteria bacterium]
TIRLREVNTLLSLRPDLVHPTLERYMGELNRLPDKHQVNDEVGFKIIEAIDTHLKVLRQIYPETASPKVKMALRSVMNRLIQRADAQSSAKLPVCALFSREASSSALNEVEKGVLTDRANKCFTSAQLLYLVK